MKLPLECVRGWEDGSVRCFSHKHENLNSDSNIYTNLGLVVGTQESQCWGGKDSRVPGTLWPSTLDNLVSSRMSERCLKN